MPNDDLDYSQGQSDLTPDALAAIRRAYMPVSKAGQSFQPQGYTPYKPTPEGLLEATGPLGEAGTALGESLRTGHFDARDLAPAAAGVMVGVAGPKGEAAAGPATHLIGRAGRDIADVVKDAAPLYHVAPADWNGGDLLPLAHKYRAGSEGAAIDQFLQRWPDASPEMAQYHVNKVHLYSNPEDALAHARDFGGRVLKIDPKQVDVKSDNLEFDHPVTDRVPTKAIKPLADEPPVVRRGEVKNATPYLSPVETAPEARTRFETEPHAGAQYPQYAEQYPDVGPPSLISKKDNKTPIAKPGGGAWTVEDASPGAEHPFAQQLRDSGQAFWQKQLTPEAQQFAKSRLKVQKEMDQKGYDPYFDPAQRAHVDPADYPTNLDMGRDAMPAKQATIDKYKAEYDTPDARDRLQKAFDTGKTVPGAEHWYAMKQLQDKYVSELGEVAGKQKFKSDFAEAMAATTGGADPTANFLMAHLANYYRERGMNPFPPSHQFPTPVGGQYAGGNMKMYEKTAGNPEFTGFDANNPKRHDFTYSFLGGGKNATIDEQMSDIIKPGMAMPKGDSYGVATNLVREMAEKNGVPPQQFQDVAWAGHKKMSTEARGRDFDYEGPMINHVNASIERTHRLTGMPREEIVRRGVVRHEIPLYGAAGAISVPALSAAIGRRQAEESSQ